MPTLRYKLYSILYTVRGYAQSSTEILLLVALAGKNGIGGSTACSLVSEA